MTVSLASQNWHIRLGNEDNDHDEILVVVAKGALAGLYSNIQQAVAPRRLFEPAYYALEYTPRNRFALDDVEQLSRAYDAASRDGRQRFRLVPRQTSNRIVFDECPVSKRLNTRAAMTRYLVDLYKAEKLSLEKLDQCMKIHSVKDLRLEIFALISDHEKPQYEYLLYVDSVKKVKDMSLEQRYLCDDIDLAQYADMKLPGRKAKRDREVQLQQDFVRDGDSPDRCLLDLSGQELALSSFTCIICAKKHEHRPPARKATYSSIKCMECANRVCRQCVASKFIHAGDSLEEARKKDSFIRLHEVYCSPKIKGQEAP